MHDLPSTTLLQQANAQPKSGEELETLGKMAASKYLNGTSSNLSEAVVETVKSAGLSPEQVKRVVEFANVSSYLERFKKEAEHKVVQFDGGPADPGAVLQDLNDGGGGTVFDRGTADYDHPPPEKVKSASHRFEKAAEDQGLTTMFEAADVPIPFSDPLRDSLDAREKLAAAHDRLISELSQCELEHSDTMDELYQQVKQACLTGTSLGRIVQAWSQVTDQPVFVKTAFQILSPRLLESQTFSSKDSIGASLQDIEKTASMVNLEHPIVNALAKHCDLLQKMAHTRAASEDVAETLDSLNTFIKAAGIKEAKTGVIPKLWRAAKGGAAQAAQKVHPAAEKLIGTRGADVVSKVVEKSPHIAAGLAGEEAYQRVKYNPWARTAYNFGMSRVPYTRANLIRKYQLQSQM